MGSCNRIFKTSLFFVLIILLTSTLLPDRVTSTPTKTEVISKTQRINMPFITNNGQMDEMVKFYANTFSGIVFVTINGEIVYSLPESAEQRSWNEKSSGRKQEARCQKAESIKQNKNLHTANLKAKIQNLNQRSAVRNLQSEISGVTLKETVVCGKISDIKGEGETVTKVNYFRGNEPSKWKTDISTYEMIDLGDVYKGIGLRLKAYGNNVEKLFRVKPGAGPNQISIRMEGIKALKVGRDGQLEAETDLGNVKFTKPIAYQEIDGKRVEVECGYVIVESGIQDDGSGRQYAAEFEGMEAEENSQSKIRIPKSETENPSPATRHSPHFVYGFKVASYDKTKDLVIDPLLASTYFGRDSDDECHSIVVDSSGTVYVTGYTRSLDFPTTTGVYDTSYHSKRDVFVSKFSSDLTTLLASTFLGGSKDEEGDSIAIDSSGNVYVTGYTKSKKFPTTTGAYDTSYNGGRNDVFISKLSGDLTTLLVSTYFGGSDSDSGNSIAIDSSGNVYIAGNTLSSDFPTTKGAYDASYNSPGSNAFILKFSSDLKNLNASTYLGGGDDIGGLTCNSIALDSGGSVFVTGNTSSDFPITAGAYDTSYNGGLTDACVSKLSNNLKTLKASTYLGGSDYDFGESIAIDSSGNVYVTGYTMSKKFPTTKGVYDTSHNGEQEVFISKLNNNLKTLKASTYLGGSFLNYGESLALDSSGNVYVMGSTYASDFPTTTGAYDTSSNGAYDIFVSKLSSDLVTLSSSTYLGGSDSELGEHAKTIAVDSGGNVYVAGNTRSSDFPTTIDAYDISGSGNYGYSNYDVFVSKFDSDLSASIATPTPIVSPSLTTSPLPSPTPSPLSMGSIIDM